ncbi:MAG: mechanosensitive ion channel family protein [Fibromonadaceae bacterium]|jgi:small-conductance mechanosensitive channel|nr:mechanosensitive ion channel family protein [Fibromonadaceae bacterium]
MDSLLTYLNQFVKIEEGVYFLGNSLWNWLLAIATATVVYFIIKPIFGLIVKKIDKVINHKLNKPGDIAVGALKHSKAWFFIAIAFFFGAKFLKLGEYDFLPFRLLMFSIFIQSGIWLNVVFSKGLRNWSQKHENPSQHTAIVIVLWFGRFLIWATVLLLILDHLGIEAVSLLAGLGVGGIAIALAMQKILGDLFASISIMLEKPFEIGDFVMVGEIRGTVESIGIKTTRIRSVNGEQIIISNSDLLESRVNNFKRMTERRIVFSLNVSNLTTKENIHAITGIVKNIIDSQENTRFDRGHLKGFSPGSIDYEFVYWVKSPEFIVYMDVQQKINLAIIDEFAERKIIMAYPAQKVMLEK